MYFIRSILLGSCDRVTRDLSHPVWEREDEGCKIMHYPIDVADTFKICRDQKVKSCPNMITVPHFEPNLVLVTVEHCMRSQKLNEDLQRVQNFYTSLTMDSL